MAIVENQNAVYLVENVKETFVSLVMSISTRILKLQVAELKEIRINIRCRITTFIQRYNFCKIFFARVSYALSFPFQLLFKFA